MSWAEIKKAVNSDLDIMPLNELIAPKKSKFYVNTNNASYGTGNVFTYTGRLIPWFISVCGNMNSGSTVKFLTGSNFETTLMEAGYSYGNNAASEARLTYINLDNAPVYINNNNSNSRYYTTIFGNELFLGQTSQGGRYYYNGSKVTMSSYYPFIFLGDSQVLTNFRIYVSGGSMTVDNVIYLPL